MTDTTTLHRLPLFGELTSQALQIVAKYLTVRSVHANEVLFEEGAPSDANWRGLSVSTCAAPRCYWRTAWRRVKNPSPLEAGMQPMQPSRSAPGTRYSTRP